MERTINEYEIMTIPDLPIPRVVDRQSKSAVRALLQASGALLESPPVTP